MLNLYKLLIEAHTDEPKQWSNYQNVQNEFNTIEKELIQDSLENKDITKS
jgi:hypothetical protein